MIMRWKKQQVWIVIAGVVVLLLVIFFISRGGAGVTQGVNRLTAADTMHVKTELVIHLPGRVGGQDRPFTQVTVRVEGDMKRADDRPDMRGAGTPELAGTMFLEARGRGNVFFADGQMRILKDRVLFNLDNLPVFVNPTGSLVGRWTEVAVPLLTTNNPEQMREALTAGLSSLAKAGTETVDGERLTRYAGTLSEEQEQEVADALRQGTSGNRAAHVVTRLLDANRVESLEVWVAGKEIRQLRAHFVRSLADGSEFDFATLSMTFMDYGKDVAIEVPERELTVRPDVFGGIFGGGQVGEVQVEAEEERE